MIDVPDRGTLYLNFLCFQVIILHLYRLTAPIPLGHSFSLKIRSRSSNNLKIRSCFELPRNELYFRNIQHAG